MNVPKEKQNQIDTRLNQLQQELDKVYSLYEQHFAGVLKREPLKEHKDLKRNMNAITAADLKTTASRFRYQGLQQKYIQFSTLWEKVLKQIEEGTYRRDLFLLDKKIKAQQIEKQKSPAPAAPPTSTSTKPLEALYEKMKQLVKAQDKLPTKEKFVAAIQKQIDEQKKKNPDRKVEIKLQRDASGSVQVKLSLQKKEAK